MRLEGAALRLTIFVGEGEFLPQLDELITEGLVIIDPVEVIRSVGRDRTPLR
jgi:hypothetical protein